MEVTGVTEDQIDIYFGWHEKVLLKAMQVHYASLSIRERMALAKITGMLSVIKWRWGSGLRTCVVGTVGISSSGCRPGLAT